MNTNGGSQIRTLNIAHRGASSLAPENTLAAARKALQLGAHMWEFDVQMTAVSRTVGDSQIVEEMVTVPPGRRCLPGGQISFRVVLR